MPPELGIEPSPFISPVQEHHIDFLLEEEFSCNPAFLAAFLEPARSTRVHSASNPWTIEHMTACDTWTCRAIRSATTNAGETDVLVVFHSADTFAPNVAILIEDKIRANFQKIRQPVTNNVATRVSRRVYGITSLPARSRPQNIAKTMQASTPPFRSKQSWISFPQRTIGRASKQA